MAYKQPSSGSFKMMGSSPAKRADVELIDPETGEIKNIGTGVGAVEAGIKMEKANDRIMEDNIMNISEEDNDNMTSEEYQDAIREGTTDINYSDEDKSTRKSYKTGAKNKVTLNKLKGKTHEPDDDEEDGTVTYSEKPIGKKTDLVRGPRGL